VYLKDIELLGFKSFPDKTVVKFSDGVTAIVGPNGCGKTNILDALRWVLGEQKPTLLRGGKMEEIIFGGTREMKPLGMAEVTLSIVNDQGRLATEYHELQITRRLFRSGDSEYLINKVPCRLKDITDLFADTGMGAHSYSVIQQHMIDSVISDKAEERRFLFEEAAGITKYKQRRRAALRKLEATENDFLRLQDIYAEVRTRVNSLYRQHKKAERFQKLTDRIKAWDLFLVSTRLKQLQAEKQQLTAQVETLSDQKLNLQTNLDQAYAGLETDRKELVDAEGQLTELNNTIYNTTEEAHRLEREISVLKEKKANATQLIERNQVDLEALRRRAGELAEQRNEAQRELARHNSELEKLSDQLAEAQSDQAQADQALLSGRLAREEHNRNLLDLEGRLSSGKAEGAGLCRQQDELSQALETVDEKIEKATPLQHSILSSIDELRAQIEEVSRRKTDNEKRQSELASRMEQQMEAGEELALELSNFAASLEACQARRDLLQDMTLQYEGYESGVVAVMEVRERWPAVAGTVADKFIPVDGMETALEAALGDMAKFLICYERRAAEEVIQFLKTEGKGRVGILVPHSGTITPAVKRPELNFQEVVGWLDTFVATDENLRPLMEAVLSRTVVFRAGCNPDVLLEHLPYGFGAVSTDGVLYHKNLIAGGSVDSFSLFRRREKVAEQDAMIEGIKEKIATAHKRKNQNTADLGALRAESGQARSQAEAITEEIDDMQSRLAETEFENRSLAGELERLESEKQNLNLKLEELRSRQYSLGLDYEQLAGRKENLVSSLNQSGSCLEDLEKAAIQAAEAVSGFQVASIEARSRVEQTASRIAHIDDITNEIEHNRSTKSAEVESARRDIASAKETVGEFEVRLKASFTERDQQIVRQEQLRTIHDDLQQKASAKEANAKQLRQEKEYISEKLHQFEIRLTALHSEISNLQGKIEEEYNVDITTLEPDRPEEKVSDEETAELLKSLKEKLRSFGAVNLLALEEYQVASEREKFLKEQLADLTTAKNDLRSTISKINHTARQLFGETLQKVRVNFQNLFVDLFEGGEANIQLTDPDDPLESDIEIIVRPRGKKLLPITMLSGGERALTAIALLFSLYLVKPSPFCILDEIDAPLDDANCQRFLTIIKNFSQDTQFIIITHNKITMQTSDNLYGVTMERAGVSKLVAVRFASSGDDSDAELVMIESGDREPVDRFVTDEVPSIVQERMQSGVTADRDDEM
jgi:chromosome segregation protein